MGVTRVLPIILVAVAIHCLSTLAHAESRTALVIGNGAYKAAPLKNPTNDALDMASALREMGFDVTLKVNVNHRDMEEAVRSFGAKLKQGGLGLFYYAGHGVQVAGENYLIPVDTKVDAEADVKFGALNAGMVLARMEDAENGLNIVILDACRTNPFSRSFRTAEQGLARMDAPKGSLIAYATAPGRVAADSVGSGRNGVYTGFLLQHMRTPGLKVEEALKRVRADVVKATKDKQIPWESSSLIGDFYFSNKQELNGTQLSVATMRPNTTTPNSVVVTDVETPQSIQLEQDNTTRIKAKMHAAFEEMANKNTMEQARAAYRRKDYTTALKLVMPMAKDDEPEAQAFLGVLYMGGDGVARDDKEAVKWLRKAAEKGHAMASYFVGGKYDRGEGTNQSYVDAAKWYRVASNGGISLAQFRLGEMYDDGRGVQQNFEEAVRLYEMAANQGYIYAQARLGWMYHFGHGVTKNLAESAKWYHLSAEQGDTKSQLMIGMMLYEGDGVQKNLPESSKWFRKAADKGAAKAQFALGVAYYSGHGVPQNFEEAMKWYRKAADQGDVMAQNRLGAMYAIGKGTPVNNKQAYIWFSLAAAQGDADAAKARNEVASMMTPAQIAEAQKTAATWKLKMVRQQ